MYCLLGWVFVCLFRWEYEEKNPFVREDPVSAPPSRIHLDWIRKPKGAKAGCC